MYHHEYIQHVRRYLTQRTRNEETRRQIECKLKEISIIVTFNFDPVLPLLESLYDPKIRTGHRDADCMLRSLILMAVIKCKGITKWVESTRMHEIYAILSGFDPHDTPGVGTYYDFLKRIIDGPFHILAKGEVRTSKYNAARHLRNLTLEKEEVKKKKTETNPNDSQSEALTKELLARSEEARVPDMFKVLEDFLIQLGVKPSIEAGLIESIHRLVIGGDGSIMESAASSTGKPTCSCASNGKRKCEHKRSYTSPTARWCYDAHTDSYLFGDRYYHLTACINGHDFPLQAIMPGGNESDYTLSLKALDRLIKAFRENGVDIGIYAFTGDGHHDTYAHYHYLEHKGIVPVIPLSESSKQSYPHALEQKGIRTDEDGTPLCPAGVRMRHFGYNKSKKTHVYVCPVKRLTHREGKHVYITHEKECPQGKDCRPGSTLAPIVTVKSDTDPRLYPPLCRESKEYRDIRNQRTATERANSTLDSYNLDRACRNADYGLTRMTLAYIAQHGTIRYLDAAKKYSKQQLRQQLYELIGWNGLNGAG